MTKKQKPVLESTIEKYLIKLCKDNDIFILKNTGMAGIPDRLLIKNGRHVFVELKRPGGKPTDLQVEVMNRLYKHGALCVVVDSKEAALSIVNEILDPRDLKHYMK